MLQVSRYMDKNTLLEVKRKLYQYFVKIRVLFIMYLWSVYKIVAFIFQ